MSLINGASGLTNPFVTTTKSTTSRLESPNNGVRWDAGIIPEFPAYGIRGGDVSFGSGTGTADDSTELDMITDDGEVDEEVSNSAFADTANLTTQADVWNAFVHPVEKCPQLC
jgi:hypothetical protein